MLLPKKPVTRKANIGMASTKTILHVPRQELVEQKAGLTRLFGMTSSSGGSSSPMSACGPDRIIPTDDEWVVGVTQPVKIRYGPHYDLQKWPLVSVPTVFKKRVEEFGEKLAMRGEDEYGRFREWTFHEYGEDVKTCAKGLLALGLPRFGAVCILGQNSPQWAIACLATIHAGGVVAGIYDTDTAQQCEHVAKMMQPTFAIVEDDHQAAKLIHVRQRVKSLRYIIQWKGKPSHPGVLKWTDLMTKGKKEREKPLQLRLNQIAINTCCLVIFTSGSTGNPKAAMLTHDYCVMTAMTWQRHVGAKMGEECFISFMPFTHASGQVAELFASLLTASPMTFAPEALRGDLLHHLQRIRPTQLYAVPRHYEKLAEKVTEILNAQSCNWGEGVVKIARRASLDYHRARIDRQPTEEEKEAYQEAKLAFLDDFKGELGLDRARSLIVGGAPFPPDLLEFFLSLDIQIFQEYGLTEVGATNIEHPDCFAPGSVGPVVDGYKTIVETSSGDNLDGEILFDGRIRFMGYVGNIEKTMEMFDSKGRVKSGDLGHYDSKGRLFITGRIKDLIITSGGKKISPRPIEQKLQEMLHPAVSSVIVIGEGRKFISVLFGLKSIPDEATGLPTDQISPITEEWLKSLGSTRRSVSEIIDLQDGPVFSRIQKAIDGYNRNHASSSVETIKKWLLLPAEFSQAGGELNYLLKLKRSFIEAKYLDKINELYSTC